MLAIGRLARVFPHEEGAAGKVLAAAIPAHQFVGAAAGAFFEEAADFGFAVQHAAVLIKYDGHQRRFELGCFVLQCEQGGGVAAFGGFVPLPVDLFGGHDVSQC